MMILPRCQSPARYHVLYCINGILSDVILPTERYIQRMPLAWGYAISLHLVWAAMLYTSETPLNITAIHEWGSAFPDHQWAATFLLASSICALVGVLRV